MSGQRLVPHPSERGAAVLEFALVLPLLLLLVFAVAEFGRAYYQVITLTHAAREGARVWALGGTTAEAVTATQAAAYPLNAITVTTSPCVAPLPTQVTVTRDFEWIFMPPGLALQDFQMTGTGVMRCGG